MKEFVTKNYQNIVLTLLGVLLVFLLIRTFTPTPDNSELIKYKLEKLDEEINTIEEQRKKIDESIQLYNENIQKIDSSLSKLRVEKNVVNNYYEKELAYQDRIDKLINADSLPWKIHVKQEPGIIIIQFPQLDTALTPAGTILFYRPSDPEKDFSVPLQLNDSSRQVIDIKGINKGKWVIKLDWHMGGKEYYFEEEVFIEH